MTHPPVNRDGGFSLIELLVVLVIISFLMAMTLPALSRARSVGRQVVALSAMRQLMLGYTTYQLDHGGRVPLGYCPATVDGSPVTVTLSSGHVLPLSSGNALPVMRYPVRLVPYVSDAWAILYNHTQPIAPPEPGDSDASVWSKAYHLSTNPTFGMNTTYVGGDLNFGGFGSAPTFRRNLGQHVVFSEQEVRTPSRLIVFADAKLRGAGVHDGSTGYHRVTPPIASGRRWRAVNDRFDLVDTGIVGLPEGRHLDAAVTGFFDGHASSLRPSTLDDMTLWANNAHDREYDY
jgi:prepilin-type N-terminal cleavage/methylation domain-containing protein